MNKKTIIIGFLSAMIAGSVVFASSASSFWPFDALFSKGQVKAVTTDIAPGNRYEAIASILSTMKSACDRFSGPQIQIEKTTDDDIVAGDNFKDGKWSEDKTGTRELASIEKVIKVRCAQITTLYDRLKKLYKILPISTPTPKLGKGCYYQEVQCIQAPCEKILVCPTPTTKPIVTRTIKTPTPKLQPGLNAR
ncbi:MAG: hypothetical protein UX08_C0003G0094 [Candidatus Collierbacteria bacterium GW2011_GWB1_45_35]|uniref:Uncharacterized protein n=2 Tax=Candidatus Collieribacteriota TaxID=1752725 RepID=A0A0G1KST0_9BACT|nr:MAG: hypothetical protein UW48_C0006G0028 [Microgenomates group bacterium GW2011_GWC1_44_23]KKT86608.1 MAG: hypothetical protein UW84_C0007G0017 [Candidatus Collierbacteria bacterium GW2011_GWA2_44_99]KKT96001.1 MAG: hypothetical protein UW96_C0002G0028 [Candidatus Collierbacteria bacterium GW2011_GWA1_45_15]KKU01126.1 MAG: hypothetical protein UX01_C0002G0092 [Candidatus Collierbacteria bacterium GW2011_GWB2_45_17]KKU05738.1 MAG: hypothetical protein UX08_C0003G0094 [Candidatus Collierbacte